MTGVSLTMRKKGLSSKPCFRGNSEAKNCPNAPISHHPLPGHGLDQRAVLLAERWHPADAAPLRGAALLKDCLLQGILQHLHIALSALGNAVNGHVLEHQDSRKEKATGSVAGWLE